MNPNYQELLLTSDEQAIIDLINAVWESVLRLPMPYQQPEIKPHVDAITNAVLARPSLRVLSGRDLSPGPGQRAVPVVKNGRPVHGQEKTYPEPIYTEYQQMKAEILRLMSDSNPQESPPAKGATCERCGGGGRIPCPACSHIPGGTHCERCAGNTVLQTLPCPACFGAILAEDKSLRPIRDFSISDQVDREAG